MNLNTFGGTIQDGDYDVLITHGNTIMRENVTFDTLVVRGILHTSLCRGRRIMMDGGILSCSGKIVSDRLSGHGSIRAKQHISSRRIGFIGEISTDANIVVKETLQIDGSIDARSFKATNARIAGHTAIKDFAETNRLEIRPIQSTMFERFGMGKYLEPNSIQRIVATSVALSNTVCRNIDAGYVALSSHSQVEKVIYDNDLRLDKTSRATLIEHRWNENDHDELQRKVA
ncbi:hypothetical protein [Bifidobacterium sp. ESL0800]|uniref:hypothetical protein n=1 Tax=Bifidobacterium sp. ESL0800 TaxID=2983236 RepID=UPI0023F8DE68|nr:hypothetical protein [Bifidobacterium sp. ESL0800]WEV76232.1 hypothetical protein OZX75_03355 [Bifidobacterium sp. ESL0800]